MEQESLKFRKILYTKIEKYFVYTSFLEFLLSTINIDETSDYQKSVWAAFNAFCLSSISYIMSVYEDLRYENYDFLPKSNANRILLRNCLEAVLILNVLENKPELATNYYATLKSDQERIADLYDYNEDEEDDKENKHFLKRFSWLPRYQGKKAKTMSDLLNYVNFDSEQQKNEYKIIIKNFDTFIHPSFNFVQSINEEKRRGNIDGVLALFIDNGIFYETAYNLFASFHSIYINDFNDDVFKILEALLQNPPFTNFLFPIDARELLKIKYTAENKVTILSGLYSTFNIQKFYQKLIGKAPDFVGGIPYIIGMIANYMNKYTHIGYTARNLIYLLQDLTPRYDDMLRAVYENNPMQFYGQSRYVIEALSIINVLLLEDEERSKIYAIHQRIKGYDAKISAVDFINANSESANLDVKTKIDNEFINLQYEKDIETLTNYYRQVFKVEVERRKIVRLNGWALYLKKINNDSVPNSPFFVNLLCECFYGKENKEVASLLLALFEESNAFTHVTPYGFARNNKKFDLVKPLIFINDLAMRLVYGILKVFRLEEHLTIEEKQEIEIGFFKAMDAIKKSAEKSFQKQE